MRGRRVLPIVTLAFAFAGGGDAAASGLSTRAYDETAGVRGILALPTVISGSTSVGASSEGVAAGPGASRDATGHTGKKATASLQKDLPAARLATAGADIPFDERDLGYLVVAAVVLVFCGAGLVGGDAVRRWRADPDRYDSL